MEVPLELFGNIIHSREIRQNTEEAQEHIIASINRRKRYAKHHYLPIKWRFFWIWISARSCKLLSLESNRKAPDLGDSLVQAESRHDDSFVHPSVVRPDLDPDFFKQKKQVKACTQSLFTCETTAVLLLLIWHKSKRKPPWSCSERNQQSPESS